MKLSITYRTLQNKINHEKKQYILSEKQIAEIYTAGYIEGKKQNSTNNINNTL